MSFLDLDNSTRETTPASGVPTTTAPSLLELLRRAGAEADPRPGKYFIIKTLDFVTSTTLTK